MENPNVQKMICDIIDSSLSFEFGRNEELPIVDIFFGTKYPQIGGKYVQFYFTNIHQQARKKKVQQTLMQWVNETPYNLESRATDAIQNQTLPYLQ